LCASGVEFIIVFLIHEVSNSSICVGESGVEFSVFGICGTSGVEFVNCCGRVRCRFFVVVVFLIHQISNSSIVVGASGVKFIIFVLLVHQVSKSSIVVGASGVEFIILYF
jgi:hypothetical protein